MENPENHGETCRVEPSMYLWKRGFMGSEYTHVTNSKVAVSHNTELRCIASLVEFSNSVSGRVPYVTASIDCTKKPKKPTRG